MLDRGFLRCPGAPQFYVRDEPRTVIEVHVDDGHLAASRETALAFVEDLRTSIKLKGGDVNEYYVRYSHLKRGRERIPNGVKLYPNEKYLRDAIRGMGLVGAKHCPTPSPSNVRGLLEAKTDPVSSEEAAAFSSAVGSLLFYIQDVPDAQFEVSICGGFQQAPIEGRCCC